MCFVYGETGNDLLVAYGRNKICIFLSERWQYIIMYSSCHDVTGTIWKKQGIMLNRDWSLWGRNHHSLNADTVSSMVSDVSLRLLAFHQKNIVIVTKALWWDLRRKVWFFRVIHAKYPRAGCLLLGNPFWSLCIDLLQFFRVLRPMIIRALWKLTHFSDVWSTQTQLIQQSLGIQPGMNSIHPLE